MNRFKILGTALAVSGVSFVGLSLTAPAYADQPGEKTVAFVVTSGDLGNRFAKPQILFTGEIGACGQPLLQVDKWRYDTPEHIATADRIIAARQLAAPNGIPEDSSIWISNVDLPATKACAPSTPEPTPTPTSEPTSTPTATPTTQPTAPTPSPSPTASVPAPIPSQTPISSPAPSATSPSTAPASASPQKPGGGTGNDSGQTQQKTATAPEADQLAFTGARDAGLRIGIGTAFITAGLLLVALARRKGERA